jgi:hypothetical protein
MREFFRSSFTCLVAPGLAVVLALFATGVARADFIVTMTQAGSNVVATGGGAIDLTGLTLGTGPPIRLPSLLNPEIGQIVLEPSLARPDDLYGGSFSGPANFGTGGLAFASGGSGDPVMFFRSASTLLVPVGYISNTPLSDSATWDHATFSSLGVTPGTYEWTWGSGSNQKFVLDVVPEPSLFVPVAATLLGWLGLTIARRRIARA